MPQAPPIQLPLFAEEAPRIRVCTGLDGFRYRMEVWLDLFDRAHWVASVPKAASAWTPTPIGGAINALARLAHNKRRRGYQDRAA